MSAPKQTSLAAANTLRVRAAAERVVTIDRERTLIDLVMARLAQPDGERGPLTVLGGGSNVVLRSRVPGVVCLMRNRGFELQPAGAGLAHVTAAAGERWHDLVRRTLGGGWSGLENLALIPGSVGAAPIQNIGAYGVELADRFVSLRALDQATGRVHAFDRRACRFGYRDSIFKTDAAKRLIILDVTLAVARRSKPATDYPDLQLELTRLGWVRPSPSQVAEAVIRVRRRKLPDPRFVGNVGSFFKNPLVPVAVADAARRHLAELVARPAGDGLVKLSAAQLIDACGWKGRQLGAVAVWHRQPLVLCTRGTVSGSDVLAVSDAIRADVAERFGVELTLEPRVIGLD